MHGIASQLSSRIVSAMLTADMLNMAGSFDIDVQAPLPY